MLEGCYGMKGWRTLKDTMLYVVHGFLHTSVLQYLRHARFIPKPAAGPMLISSAESARSASAFPYMVSRRGSSS